MKSLLHFSVELLTTFCLVLHSWEMGSWLWSESGSISWTWSELVSVTVIALEQVGSREFTDDT